MCGEGYMCTYSRREGVGEHARGGVNMRGLSQSLSTGILGKDSPCTSSSWILCPSWLVSPMDPHAWPPPQHWYPTTPGFHRDLRELNLGPSAWTASILPTVSHPSPSET